MTSALALKVALIDRIGRMPAFRNRQVSLAHPGASIEAESVFIAGLSASDRGRREVLTLEVAIVAEVIGDDADDAESRAWQMFNDVEDSILNDPSLDGKCLFAEITSFDQRAYAGDQKRACEITVNVEITADKDLT